MFLSAKIRVMIRQKRPVKDRHPASIITPSSDCCLGEALVQQQSAAAGRGQTWLAAGWSSQQPRSQSASGEEGRIRYSAVHDLSYDLPKVLKFKLVVAMVSKWNLTISFEWLVARQYSTIETGDGSFHGVLHEQGEFFIKQD